MRFGVAAITAAREHTCASQGEGRQATHRQGLLHHVEEWPDAAEIIEPVPTAGALLRAPSRPRCPSQPGPSGAAIDLVLDRGRENRPQIIITNARGRQKLFWPTARTSTRARPSPSLPGARASGLADLEIAADIRERHPFTFADRQATVRRERLKAGDCGLLVDGLLRAMVERESLADLVTSLTTGKLTFQPTELAAIPHAAVVVEEGCSRVFKVDRVRRSAVADGIAEYPIRPPTLPLVDR